MNIIEARRAPPMKPNSMHIVMVRVKSSQPLTYSQSAPMPPVSANGKRKTISAASFRFMRLIKVQFPCVRAVSRSLKCHIQMRYGVIAMIIRPTKVIVCGASNVFPL